MFSMFTAIIATYIYIRSYEGSAFIVHGIVNYFVNFMLLGLFSNSDQYATDYPDHLHQGRMHLVNDDVCGNDPDVASYNFLPNKMQCAGYDHGYVTVCNVSDAIHCDVTKKITCTYIDPHLVVFSG